MYTLFLHKTGTDPKTGFGYSESDGALRLSAADVLNLAKLWSSYTDPLCPHAGFLSGAKCKLCGNSYSASRLLPDGSYQLLTDEVLKEAEAVEQQLSGRAGLDFVEFEIPHSTIKMTGFVLTRNGERLPGSIALNLSSKSAFLLSLELEIERYTTAYGVYNKDLKKVEFGPWADVTADELRELFMQLC